MRRHGGNGDVPGLAFGANGRAGQTNTGAENFTLNTWDFELRTATGTTIKHTSEGAAYGYPEFKKMVRLGKQIPPGATVTTPLLYDIAKGTQGIDLVFAQDRNRPINVG